MQTKSLRNLLLVLLWTLLIVGKGKKISGQDLQEGAFPQPENNHLGLLQVKPPSVFFSLNNEQNELNSLVTPVGKVYDTLVDLKKLAQVERSGDILVRRVKIEMKGALGLILYFRKLSMPQDAVLIYKSGKASSAEKKLDREMVLGGPFSLPMVEGESIELIWSLSSDSERNFEALLTGIGVVLYPQNTSIGGSGACEVNVNCPEGDAWKNQRDAVVRILVRNKQSVYWCTGVLVNNTALDKTPYILTANHCGKGATPENVAQWQFFFNYESEGCPNPMLEPEQKMVIGGRKKAASDSPDGKLGSDFYLLTLLNGIPAGARAYFAGWSRKDEPAPYGVCIHHPQGDLKKISTFTTPAISASWESTPGTHWKVVWSATSNGHGVTEGGSSGSPLFNPDGLLVGTLTGGQASCDSASLNQPDYFGKFSYHWNSNGTADTLQLGPYLDPSNTGAVTLEGTPLAIDDHPSKKYCISIVPNPVSQAFNIGGLPPSLETEPLTVSVYDLSGKLMLQHTISASFNSVSIASLSPGIYLVKVETIKHVFFQKLVKN